ncbi:hypothetical protein EDD11_007082 [Mortierella claussenii]|nr:hypothetical protein EDD11_007082 [Mortierella claussenii]
MDGITKFVLSLAISPRLSSCPPNISSYTTMILSPDLIAIPAYFGVAIMINTFYIFKGVPKSGLRKTSIGFPIGIAVVADSAIL